MSYYDDEWGRRRPRRSWAAIFKMLAIFLGILAILGSFGFSLYLLIMIIGPWILSALMAAAVPYALALFMLILPALIFAAPLFALLCWTLSRLYFVNFVETKSDFNFPDDDVDHLDSYYQRRLGWRPDRDENPNFHRLRYLFFPNLIIATLSGIGAGSYLAAIILPSFIMALTAAAIHPILALSAAVLLGIIFIVLSTLFLMAPSWIAWRRLALPGFKDIQENPLQVLPFLGMFAGLALGGYLASLVYPLILSALLPLAIPHASIVFLAIIVCSELVFASSFCSFAAASAIPYLFNQFRFPAMPRYQLRRLQQKLSGLLKWQPKSGPIPQKIDPITQAIAYYHENKSFWWKLLAFISFGHYGSHPDIRKIEAVLKANPSHNEGELKRIIGERFQHTQGTPQFYLKSPFNRVNQAYVAIAQALAGGSSESSSFLSIAACRILIPALKGESTLYMQQDEKKAIIYENCLDQADLDKEDWDPGNFLITERGNEVYAWSISDIARQIENGQFAFAKHHRSPDDPIDSRDFLTPFEDRLIRMHSSPQAQQWLKEAEEEERMSKKIPTKLPPDALKILGKLIAAFQTKTGSAAAIDEKKYPGENYHERSVDKGYLAEFYTTYLPSLSPGERSAFLKLAETLVSYYETVPFSALIYREVSNIFVLHDRDEKDSLELFFTQVTPHAEYKTYQALVNAVITEFFQTQLPSKEAKNLDSSLAVFMKAHSEYAQYKQEIDEILTACFLVGQDSSDQTEKRIDQLKALFKALDPLLKKINPALFSFSINVQSNELRSLFLHLTLYPGYKCNDAITTSLKTIKQKLEFPQQVAEYNYVPQPSASERLKTILEKQKKSWRELLPKAILAAFYNEEGNILYADFQAEVLEAGLSHALRDNLSPYKLYNPLCWLEFLLILIATSIPAVINQLFFIVTLPLTYWSWFLARGMGEPFSPNSTIVALGQLPLDILLFIWKCSVAAILFFLRTLTSPLQTVLLPLYKLYQKQPLRSFSLLLLSGTLVAFLMTGFGLGGVSPGVLWFSQALFSAASLLAANSPVFTPIIGLLLITLLLYETVVILDLLLPCLKAATLALYRCLYFISESRFEEVDFVMPTFETRYHLALTMPVIHLVSSIPEKKREGQVQTVRGGDFGSLHSDPEEKARGDGILPSQSSDAVSATALFSSSYNAGRPSVLLQVFDDAALARWLAENPSAFENPTTIR